MFYLKLAISNIRNSLKNFAPFLLASLVLYVLNGSTLLVLTSPVAEGMRHGNMALGLAVVVLSLFSLIMEIYSFNFLVKQRTREFGLYNMLGMTKFQIGLVASLELATIGLALALVGSVMSSIFANLFNLVFANLVRSVTLDFAVSPLGLVMNAGIFAGIFGILILLALVKVGRTSPLVLFRSSEAGEREPRGNWLLALVGILALAGGYTLSLTSSKIAALAVLFRFFFAVLLVILGTYLFYISVVAWFLKRRRANKAYFYQSEHFISTSQMLFRMKQHAVGLGNITLLAIMSFVTIAGTTSLYGNTEYQAARLFPRSATVLLEANSRAEAKAAYQSVLVDQLGYSPQNTLSSMVALMPINIPDGKKWTVTVDDLKKPSPASLSYMIIMSQEDFRGLGNDLPQLKPGETAFYLQRTAAQFDTIDFLGQAFRNVKNYTAVNVPNAANLYSAAVLVLASDEERDQVLASYKANSPFKLGQSDKDYIYQVHLDLEQADIDRLVAAGVDIDTKADYLVEMNETSGGFLFTGFLLGSAFLAGAALIIYYKQYSEGYEDKKSYRILQEVGMSQETIKKTINGQVLTVFFMPIVMAVLHFLVALTMIKQMLLLFGVTDTSLIYTISGGSILVIMLLYFGIYKLTSRTYYRMIER